MKLGRACQMGRTSFVFCTAESDFMNPLRTPLKATMMSLRPLSLPRARGNCVLRWCSSSGRSPTMMRFEMALRAAAAVSDQTPSGNVE